MVECYDHVFCIIMDHHAEYTYSLIRENLLCWRRIWQFVVQNLIQMVQSLADI